MHLSCCATSVLACTSLQCHFTVGRNIDLHFVGHQFHLQDIEMTFEHTTCSPKLFPVGWRVRSCHCSLCYMEEVSTHFMGFLRPMPPLCWLESGGGYVGLGQERRDKIWCLQLLPKSTPSYPQITCGPT